MTFSELPPDCQWAQHELFEARDGMPEKLRIHLAGCDQCRQAQAWDDRFSSALARASEVSVPAGLPKKVLRRATGPAWWRRAAVGVAAAVLIAAGLAVAWHGLSRPAPVVKGPEPRPERTNGIPEAAALFAAPPVDSLDVLARQQAALLVALEQMEKE